MSLSHVALDDAFSHLWIDDQESHLSVGRHDLLGRVLPQPARQRRRTSRQPCRHHHVQSLEAKKKKGSGAKSWPY